MMTLHASKGQEFKNVLITGTEEELLPHLRSMDIPQEGDPQDGELEGETPEVAEERRLLFVGLTHATDQVLLTRARSCIVYGNARPSRTSRFLHEVSHRHYGPGLVVGFAGRDLDARVLVHFEAHGVKELFLQHTSLRREGR